MRATHQDRLPIDDVLPEALAALESKPNLVLVAATGAGKTTRVPPALEAAGFGPVVMLEPRRVAARAAARRMAEERDWRLGDEVGYQVRFERVASDSTRVLVVTEGLLVKRLQQDPFLEGIGTLVFDEFHERNLASDLSLAMARKVQREARPDLRLVVMSATLDPVPLVAFLGGPEACSSIHSEGRLFPVEVRYLARPDARGLPTLVREAVTEMLEETPGDLLVFLPGVGEIRRCEEFLQPVAKARDLDLALLYGDLAGDRQDAALRRGARRRVVLSTNVAETSVTVDGVTGVLDSGLVRRLRFDPGVGLDRLELGRISLSSAEQRSGRAGRQQPGLCRRLWTEHDHRSLAAQETPEVRRVDLAPSALELLVWGESDLQTFPWFEAPEVATLERALSVLADLGAVRQARGRVEVAAVGRVLARLPVHPRLGRLLIAGHGAGCLQEAALAAALLSERDLVFRPVSHRPVSAMRAASSDVVDRLEGVLEFERSGYGETALGPVDRGRSRHVLRVARQLARSAGRSLGPAGAPADLGTADLDTADLDTAVRWALLAAFPDRVARRREAGSRRAVVVGGRGVRLAEMSAVVNAELFVAVEIDAGQGSEALVRQASAVEVDWLEPQTEHDEAYFDVARGRVLGRRQTRYRDLVLFEVEVDPGPERAAEALAAAARNDLESALGMTEPPLAGFLNRVRSLAGWMPELGLPTYEREQIEALLPSLCAGRRSFAELRRAPILDVLRGSLDYSQLTALGKYAPEALEVPSGSQIRLQYAPGEPPVLAVRIQEMFGQETTPTIAAGRVAVLLHLLAPSGRPQQVTRDLESFWRSTYAEVRKQLAGRYPKHAWPEDPLTAEPMRGAKRRRS